MGEQSVGKNSACPQADEKPLRLVAFDAGDVIEDARYANWAQIGEKLTQLLGATESITVYEDERRVLIYHMSGIF